MITETRFKISVPRFQRSPVDTFRFSQMIRKQYNNRPHSTSLIERIREIIIGVVGHDPYDEPKGRRKEYVKARQLFLFFVRRYTKLSQQASGEIIGKDHATVVHAEKCVKRFSILEADYGRQYAKIETEIFKVINQ